MRQNNMSQLNVSLGQKQFGSTIMNTASLKLMLIFLYGLFLSGIRHDTPAKWSHIIYNWMVSLPCIINPPSFKHMHILLSRLFVSWHLSCVIISKQNSWTRTTVSGKKLIAFDTSVEIHTSPHTSTCCTHASFCQGQVTFFLTQVLIFLLKTIGISWLISHVHHFVHQPLLTLSNDFLQVFAFGGTHGQVY